MDDIDCVRNELMERNFAPERIRRHSLFAANMLTWCIKVVQQFDFITLVSNHQVVHMKKWWL